MSILITLLSFLAATLLFFSTKTIMQFSLHKAIYYCSDIITSFSIPIPQEMMRIFFFLLLALIVISLLRIVQVLLATFLIAFFSVKHTKYPKHMQYLVQKYDMETYVYIINDSKPLAFTSGIVDPKIYISKGLITLLTTAELEAVLLHEAYHYEHQHTRGRLLQNFAKIFLPIIPLMSELISRQNIFEEMQADAAAVRQMESSENLLSALKKLLLVPSPSSLTPAFATYATLEARIMALQRKDHSKIISIKTIVFSIFSILLLSSIALTPVQASAINIKQVCKDTCTSACHTNVQGSNTLKNISLPATFIYTSAN